MTTYKIVEDEKLEAFILDNRVLKGSFEDLRDFIIMDVHKDYSVFQIKGSPYKLVLEGESGDYPFCLKSDMQIFKGLEDYLTKVNTEDTMRLAEESEKYGAYTTGVYCPGMDIIEIKNMTISDRNPCLTLVIESDNILLPMSFYNFLHGETAFDDAVEILNKYNVRWTAFLCTNIYQYINLENKNKAPEEAYCLCGGAFDEVLYTQLVLKNKYKEERDLLMQSMAEIDKKITNCIKELSGDANLQSNK